MAESSLTLATYLVFDSLFGTNLVSLPALGLLPYLFIPVFIGVPLGTLLLTAVSPEFFRRFVMAVDGVFVSYGLSRVVIAVKWMTTVQGNILLGILLLALALLSWIALNRIAGGVSISPRRTARTPGGCSRLQPRPCRGRRSQGQRDVLAVKFPGPPGRRGHPHRPLG